VSEVAGEKVSKSEVGTRYLVMATWDDAPHLTTEMKETMLLELPLHQRDARSRGIPALGSGVIYPVPESDIRVSPFEIPAHWPRAFGMDIDAGVGFTAAVWVAWDREANVYYLYDCYKRGHAETIVHAEAIKARGAWIPGVADAAALLVTNSDAVQFIDIYKKHGLDVKLPDKAVEAGIQTVWELLSGGRLKVFSSCGAWFEEFRLYRRDEKGRIVKQNDHLLDGCRYVLRACPSRMKTRPGGVEDTQKEFGKTADRAGRRSEQSWMQ
jgi:hypothetical protein